MSSPKRRIALTGTAGGEFSAELAKRIVSTLESRGLARIDEPREADFVIKLFPTDEPSPIRRHSRGTYVAALHERPELPAEPLQAEYPLLVRNLANVVLCAVPDDTVLVTTPEQGTYRIQAPNAELADAVVERIEPLATSRLVIDNEFRPDLEPELWQGDEVTEEFAWAGRQLDSFGLLPAAFPVHELLSEREFRHVKRLWGLGGLSYGNMSARKDERRFWMSASGVDKSNLREIGRDILLVSDYDEPRATIVLSVPPGVEPRRVSVDAIEHWTIYQRHPDVGAIMHVHAWVEGIKATQVNFPCGTEELALAVSGLIDREPDPSHAVVGLRNHGITATGESLREILERIQSRVLPQVPMT
ncbi:MAG: class II aldolase/adducin family protein [Gaiellaceae bacterium]